MKRKIEVPKGTKLRKINISRKTAECPKCGCISKRHSLGNRYLHELGSSMGKPVMVEVTYSKHYCLHCRKHFSLTMDYLAPPRCQYTNRVRKVAIELVRNQSFTYEQASIRMKNKNLVDVPITTIFDWVSQENWDLLEKAELV